MERNEKMPWDEDAPGAPPAGPTDAATTATAEPPRDDAAEGERKPRSRARAGAAAAEPKPDRPLPPEPAVGEADYQLPVSDALDKLLAEQRVADEAWTAAIGEDGELPADLAQDELEGRAKVEAIEYLHHRRRVIARVLAPMAVLFKDGGVSGTLADQKRKQYRQFRMTCIQRERGILGDKIESMLERLVAEDRAYLAYCDELDALRLKWFLGRVALDEMTEKIRDREERLRAYNSELRAGVGGQV